NAGIKIISYDRLVNNAPLDLYLSFDNEKVGEYQAQYVINALKGKINKGSKLKVAYVGGSDLDNNSLVLRKGSYKVLQPLIDDKSIEIVFDKYTKDWNPDIAYSGIKDYLKKNNNKLDAVVAANDGTAFGSITALAEVNLSGKIPVSGQDAELAAARRIIAGTQTMTVYKPIPELASAAAEAALTLAEGNPIKADKIVNNGKMDVPSMLLLPIVVTKDNIDDTLIKDGYHSREDIYKK
ncbi:substrate-binding domain-containing protein, partial [Candidatus Nomurabacteria bacterium]|nr:substrate-binding domain-containing protein [Candidatus Nomurabacteria bacterium]